MSRPSNAMGYYIILSIVFLLLAAVLPANQQASQLYHLSNSQYHLLFFLVILPLMLLSFLAIYGYVKLQNYANSIDKTPEGHDFNLLANGCRWLAWGLLVPAVVEIILNSIANVHPGFHAAAIVGTNYLYLVVPLVAFSLISNGSHGLLSRTKQQLSISNTKSLILVLVLIGVAYCFLIFRHYIGNSLGSTNNPFHLPLWLMLITMVIPYLYAWFVGLLAVYEIVLFSKQSRGVLYQQALQLVAYGLVIVIAGSIALQYVGSIVPSTGHLVLNTSLAATYVIRLVAVAGYILIARGAIRLKKIEEV